MNKCFSLPISPYLSLSLPFSPLLSLFLPFSPFLSLSLPFSPFLSLSLPFSLFLSFSLFLFLQNWYYYTLSEILYKLQLTIHRTYYFYYLLFIQLSQHVAARQREPYRYSMCCLRTFCILLIYIFMLSQYVFYNIMHCVK